MRITPDLMSGVALLSVHIRELRFTDDLDQVGAAQIGGAELNIEFQEGSSDDSQEGSLILRVSILPPGDPPLFRELFVSIEGRFRQLGSPPLVDLRSFLRGQGPIILMPFARDAIATATQKTRFGAVLLPPLNVAAMLERMGQEKEPSNANRNPD
jgi:preprotein translocase subunit SecB